MAERGQSDYSSEEEMFVEPMQPVRTVVSSAAVGSSTSGSESPGTGSTSGQVASTSDTSPARPVAKRGRPPKRPRGRGRPRGGGRGGGSRATSAEVGTTSRRGRRKRLCSNLPQTLSEADVESLRDQQSQRRQELKDLMSTISREDLEELVIACCERSPAFALDVEHTLKEKSGQAPEPASPEPASGVPSWCVCGRCREMPTLAERKCCNQPAKCKSLDPIMDYNITHPFHLVMYRVIRGDYEGRDDDREEGEEDNASMRHAAYRSYIAWQFHKLTAGDRRVIPSCCIWKIRDKFPSPTGQYRGFLPGRRV